MARKFVSRIRSTSSIGSRSKPDSQNHLPNWSSLAGKGLSAEVEGPGAAGKGGRPAGVGHRPQVRRAHVPLRAVISQSAPARKPTLASPVQSANHRPAKRCSRAVRMSWATTAAMRSPCFSTLVDVDVQEQRTFFSARTSASRFWSSYISAVPGWPCGAAPARAPRRRRADRGLFDLAAEPDADLRAVVAAQHGPVLDQGHVSPSRAAERAAVMPAIPPPTTTRSKPPAVLGLVRQPEQLAGGTRPAPRPELGGSEAARRG